MESTANFSWALDQIKAGKRMRGDGPWLLTASHVPMLEGMAAMTHEPQPLKDLIEAISEHGRIRVWLEW